jgi:8-oxo-dGTP diphosphatase
LEKGDEVKRMLKACCVIEDDNKKYLVLKRSDKVSMTGVWEFPAGRLNDDEAAVDAAAREVREETGLGIESIDPLKFYEHFDDETRQVYRAVFIFLVKPKSTEVKISEEHDAYEWLTPQEILQKEKIGMDTKYIVQRLLH